MEGSVKKILLVILGINGFLFSNFSKAAITADDEQAAIQGMVQALESATTPTVNKAMDELLGANVRADSMDPKRFLPGATLKIDRVKFETTRSLPKWQQIEIVVQASTDDKNLKYVDRCGLKVYIGYDNRLPNGKRLLFKGEAICATLPTNENQSILFFIPGDIRLRYNLPDIPDYCAIHLSVDGVYQKVVIVGKDGKDAYYSDSTQRHKAVKEQSLTEDRVLRNADQLPVYSDIKIKTHPTLLLDVDA